MRLSTISSERVHRAGPVAPARRIERWSLFRHSNSNS
jgi:hypothetical protein